MSNYFTDQIITFLEKDLEKVPESDKMDRENRLKVINYFKTSKGQCHGLAFLQAYGRRIDDDNKDDKVRENVDDIHFFERTKGLLLDWNREDSWAEKDQKDVERLISNILLYQRFDLEFAKYDSLIFPHLTQDPDKILQDTIRGEIVKSFGYKPDTTANNHPNTNIITTREMLQSRLEEIVNPQNIILLHFDDHTVAIYQDKNNKIYLYNNENELLATDKTDLTNQIWNVTNPSNFTQGFNTTFAPSDQWLRTVTDIQIYKFPNDPQYDCPTNLQISKEEFKSFSEKYPKLAILAEEDDLFSALLNSMNSDDAWDLYNDQTLDNESIRTAMLSRAMTPPWEAEYHKPIFSLPQMMMSLEMLSDRLAKLDKENIGRIFITSEIDGSKHQVATIRRDSKNKKPFTLLSGLGNLCDCNNMTEIAKDLWNVSNPGRFRVIYPIELSLRKLSIHIFEGLGNEHAKIDCPTTESFQATIEELLPLKDSPLFQEFKNHTLVKSFLKQFPRERDGANVVQNEHTGIGQHPYTNLAEATASVVDSEQKSR
ncbi:MAG: hypothetical protein V4694_06225 [Pseudomonadota bacterium]